MAMSNRERVGKSLELLADGLRPFVERELKSRLKENWQSVVSKPPGSGPVKWSDPQILLQVMCDQWNIVFKDLFGTAERSLVFELKDARNKWAHNEQFSSNDTLRAIDSVHRLLESVSAPEPAGEVDAMRMDLMRVIFDDKRRNETRKVAFSPLSGKPSAGLKPWREIATPHPDVASGKFQQAEFAADLWQIYEGEGTEEYRNPTEFFRRTFLTEGLRDLLSNSLLRLSSNAKEKKGDPVIELQTNFGGGKTHSMLALYHLYSGAKAVDLPGVDQIVHKNGNPIPANVRRAVIVGTKISPGQEHKKKDGTIVRTLWGEIAWQLGGKEGYAMVADDDKHGTSPGNTLKDLFNKYGPCLILIDEWVAYARQLHEDKELPAGTFETQFTFAQTLSESAKAANNTLLVVSIPASTNPTQTPGHNPRRDLEVNDIEVGGTRGQEAVDKLKNAVGRVEASWRPASPDEGFEIVRRRLFQPLSADQSALQDAVARSFSELYQSQPQEFPPDCREGDYERRMKLAYPIHPELFDRLYQDWSTLPKFQRTRGVLRLMATVIHSLWERNDSSLLIMPSSVPIDDTQVQQELTRYMPDDWAPVINKDVDGGNSLPVGIDRENANLGRYSATRRVSRTIYMGSAPTFRLSNKGLDERQVKLGCVQPGETVATFGDALRRLTDKATYLYADSSRYWFSTQPTVTRMADDRASQYALEVVEEEIKRRLKPESSSRGDFSKVHHCPASTDIPDERETRLVLLAPDFPHANKDNESPARKEAASILDTRGNSPRIYKNSLVFLAPDSNRLKDLIEATRRYLAWESILRDKDTLNLDAFQTNQATSQKKSSNETVDSRIPETYIWCIVPVQSNPRGTMEWREIKINGKDGLAKGASKKLITDELLITRFAGTRLRMEMDRIPLWKEGEEHVSTKSVLEDFARYIYMPRLRDEDVLTAAMSDGTASLNWVSETFAYADSYDVKNKQYRGLMGGKAARIIIDTNSVLVRPDTAFKHLQEAEEARKKVVTGDDFGGTITGGGTDIGTGKDTTDLTITGRKPGTTTVTPKREIQRFHATTELDPTRLARDAGQIAQEIITHLSDIVGSDVRVTLTIEADFDRGVPDNKVRIINENCSALKFKNADFES